MAKGKYTREELAELLADAEKSKSTLERQIQKEGKWAQRELYASGLCETAKIVIKLIEELMPHAE